MYKGLTNEELFRLKKDGDREARNYLIINNMSLAYKIAHKYKKVSYADFENIIQEANIGLIKAVDGFNIDSGFKFSTYAYMYIEGNIKHYIRDYREDIPYRVKKGDMDYYVKVLKLQKAGLSISEISKELESDIEQIEKVISILRSHKSIYASACKEHDKSNTDTTHIDMMRDKNELTQNQITEKISIQESIKKLNPKHQKVIELRYFKDLTQKQAAEVLNVTQANVSYLERGALKELKEII